MGVHVRHAKVEGRNGGSHCRGEGANGRDLYAARLHQRDPVGEVDPSFVEWGMERLAAA